MSTPGQYLRAEIHEIPDVIDRIAAAPPVARAERSFAVVGHGSSLNAAAIAMEYLAPSGFYSRMGTPQTLSGVAAHEAIIAVSQSGRTVDVIDWLQKQDRPHYLLTNNDEIQSDGERTVVHLQAGHEESVCATKTVIATMMTLDLMLLDGYSQRERITAWKTLATHMRKSFESTLDELRSEHIIEDVAGARAIWVLGEHAFLPAAQEVALKLQESSGRLATALPIIGGQHGPLVAIQPDDVILWAGDYRSNTGYHQRTQSMHLLPTTGHGSDDEILECAATLVTAQLLVLEVALRLGQNPDTPPGLSKITNP